jgi:hypothetical protein
MPRVLRITLLTALTVIGVMFCLVGRAAERAKPANPALPPELSLYAGSKSCIECHKKFYQLWASSRHGLAMQPYTPEFARTHLTPPEERPGHRQRAVSGRHWPQGRLGPCDRPQRQEEKIPLSPCPGRQERLLLPDPPGTGALADPAGGL